MVKLLVLLLLRLNVRLLLKAVVGRAVVAAFAGKEIVLVNWSPYADTFYPLCTDDNDKGK